MERVQKISAAISIILTIAFLGAWVLSFAATPGTTSGVHARIAAKPGEDRAPIRER